MASHKIYAGASLRETRNRHGLTQRVFADRLGVSLPYLSQMENNHRPVSAGVLLRLASEFSVDVGALEKRDADRMVVDLAEALADEDVAAIYSSDLQRAHATASRVGQPGAGRQRAACSAASSGAWNSGRSATRWRRKPGASS